MTTQVLCSSPLLHQYPKSHSDPSQFDFSEILHLPDSKAITYCKFQNAIVAFYGVRLAHELEVEYGNFGKDDITVREIKERLVSIAALVKKEDLITLFNAIHADSKELLCMAHLSQDELREIRKCHNFDNLDHSQMEILLSVYRYFPNPKGAMQAIGSLFFSLKEYPKVSTKNQVFAKHLTMIRAFERADHFIQDKTSKNFAMKQKLAASEHKCREIAYGVPLNTDLEKQIQEIKKKNILTPDELKHNIETLIKKEVVGTIFPTLNAKGEKVFCEIKSSVFENGLVAYFCGPFTTGQWKNDPNSAYPLEILFRGTWCLNSLKRDVTEGIEVGKNSFFGLTPSIIECLEDGIPDEVETVSCSLGGHSLGGVDASRLVALLAKIRVQRQRELGEDHISKSDKIRTIELTTWNSPGVLKATAQEYNDCVGEIQKNPILPLTFKHTHVKVGEDVFQNFGKTLLGWRDPKKNRVNKNHNTKIVKFRFKNFYTFIGTTWFAHRLPCLSVDARKNIMSIKRGNINHKLGPRSVYRWVKLIAKAIFRRAFRIPMAIVVFFARCLRLKKDQDNHKVFQLLAIRKIFHPDLKLQST